MSVLQHVSSLRRNDTVTTQGRWARFGWRCWAITMGWGVGGEGGTEDEKDSKEARME